MKYALIITLLTFCTPVIAQKLSAQTEYKVGDKIFKTTKKIGTDSFLLQNIENISFSDRYKSYRIGSAKYDRQKLIDAVLQVFTKAQIEDFKNSKSNALNTLTLNLHLARSGNICAITFLMDENSKINLEELSRLEDIIKKDIILSEFLNEKMNGHEYFTITLFLNLPKISRKSFSR